MSFKNLLAATTRMIGVMTAMIAANDFAFAQSFDTPTERMRPIGSPSAVDQYQRGDMKRFGETRLVNETSYQNQSPSQQYSSLRSNANAFEVERVRQMAARSQPSRIDQSNFRPSPTTYDSAMENGPAVRQTVMLQQSGIVAPGLPSGGIGFPPDGVGVPSSISPSGTFPQNLPSAPPVAPAGPTPALPVNPAVITPVPGNLPSGSVGGDYVTMPQPQLDGGFATIGNCNCVSAPSTYSAAVGNPCGTPIQPVSYTNSNPYAPAPVVAVPQTYVAPPTEVAPPVILPETTVPLATPLPPSAAPTHSLITLGQQTYPVEVGRGLWGQPVAYVPGQRVRNWVRYFFP